MCQARANITRDPPSFVRVRMMLLLLLSSMGRDYSRGFYIRLLLRFLRLLLPCDEWQTAILRAMRASLYFVLRRFIKR